MTTPGRLALQSLGTLLLLAGVFGLGLGFVLRHTGIFGVVLLAGGGYLAFHGAALLVEAWLARRRER